MLVMMTRKEVIEALQEDISNGFDQNEPILIGWLTFTDIRDYNNELAQSEDCEPINITDEKMTEIFKHIEDNNSDVCDALYECGISY